MKHWSMNDVAWDSFDASRVDPDIVPLVKAAAMVEKNGLDYAVYLGRVFRDDPDFRQAREYWAVEEVQHGDALGKWAALADPGWDFDAAFERYRNGYKLPLDADASIRGSRTGELIARCMVETGTSSYYTALGRRDRRAGAEAGLPADRGGRISAFQAVLRPHEAVSGAREAGHRLAGADRDGADHGERGRRTGLCLPLRQRAGGDGLRPRALHRGLHVARDGFL